jgi:hypothetical protein
MNRFDQLPLELQNYIYKFVGCHPISELYKKEHFHKENYNKCDHCNNSQTGYIYNRLKIINNKNKIDHKYLICFGDKSMICDQCFSEFIGLKWKSNHDQESNDKHDEYIKLLRLI